MAGKPPAPRVTERTRVFTGVDPGTGDQVMVQIFEQYRAGDIESRIVGMEVATRPDSRATWGVPTAMTEEA